MMSSLTKESCEYCGKFIYIGQAILECNLCDAVIHTKCFKKSNFKFENNTTYCYDCHSNKVVPRYNPFKICKTKSCDDEKCYNEEPIDFIDTVEAVSNILESCTSFNTMDELNESNFFVEQDKLSTMFLNIDGNKSNFDEFVVLLRQLKHKFSVIALAETNTKPELKNMYSIDGYTSFYQDPKPGKSKGTGVALYILDSLNATINNELSFCSDNLESIFVDINLGNNSKLNLGVLYRPPDGNATEFLEEFKILLEIMPPKNAYIMGDFNFDLLKIETESSRNFEDIILTSKFFPLISTYTHSKPNCKKSCIDNILTNMPENIIASGTIQESVSHHYPIFCICNQGTHTNSAKNEAITIHYDFSNENISKFVSEIGPELENMSDSKFMFSDFFDKFNKTLDKACKLEKPKISKRNNKVNPWITASIIKAVKHKRKLYNDWRKSKSKKLPDGDPNLHKIFADYRRILKHTIKRTKSSYYCTKINEQ